MDKEYTEDYDWKEAFAYADGFTMDDVEQVLFEDRGENDGPEWIMAGKLKDGRYFMLKAGCDYTGWDCQAGGTCTFANTAGDLVRWNMTTNDRERFGLPVPK